MEEVNSIIEKTIVREVHYLDDGESYILFLDDSYSDANCGLPLSVMVHCLPIDILLSSFIIKPSRFIQRHDSRKYYYKDRIKDITGGPFVVDQTTISKYKSETPEVYFIRLGNTSNDPFAYVYVYSFCAIITHFENIAEPKAK